jgi:Bacterial Ig-like domain (group 3)
LFSNQLKGMYMVKGKVRALTAWAAALTAAGLVAGFALAGSGVALAAGGGGPTPPWYPLSPVPYGGITFYNAQGQVVTGGSITAPGLAAYAVADAAEPGSGYSKATMYIYTPVASANPYTWTGTQISSSTAYPNASAPVPVSTTANPVVTEASTDETLATAVFSDPNVQTASGYAGLYDVRIKVGGVGIPQDTKIWDVVISVDITAGTPTDPTAGTWSVDYPDFTADTTTAVSAAPSGPDVVLSAAVSPATAGTVGFWTGYGTSGAAQVGTTQTVTSSDGTASVTIPAPSGSTTYTAVFTPVVGSADIGSTGTVTYPPAVSTTTTLAATPAGSAQQGSPVQLAATVTAADSSTPTGSVTFKDNGSPVGTASLSGGVATLTTSSLAPSAPGGAALTATYTPAGGTSYGSSSGSLSYTVNPVAATPALSGPGQVGQKETCSEKAGPGVSVAYAWLVKGKSVGTSSTLVVPASAYNQSLTCRVSVHDGSGPVSSATSAAVKVKLGKALTATKKPALSGAHAVGKTETVKPGTWSQKGAKFTYQWLLNGKVIKGATKSSFKPSRSDKGKKLSCKVTAHLSGYANGSATTSSVKIS